MTETDELARVLDAAAVLWPEQSQDRAALLRRVIQRGAENVATDSREHLERRRAAIRRAAGSVTGVYPSDARETLRDEWPA